MLDKRQILVTRKRCVIAKFHKSSFWMQFFSYSFKKSRFFSKNLNSVTFKVSVVDSTAKDALFCLLTYPKQQKYKICIFLQIFFEIFKEFSKITKTFSSVYYFFFFWKVRTIAYKYAEDTKSIGQTVLKLQFLEYLCYIFQ